MCSAFPDHAVQFFEMVLKDGKSNDPRKADCRKCRYRLDLPGSTHVGCTFGGPENVVYALAGAPEADTPLGKVGLVAADPQAIRMGWFVWPLDFDPAWLWWCVFFEEVEDERCNSPA